MKKLKDELINTYKTINPVARLSIKYVNMLAFAMLICAIFIYILASDDISNWKTVELSRELAESALGCCLASLVSSLISEIIYKNYCK